MDLEEALNVLKIYYDWMNEKKSVKLAPIKKRKEAMQVAIRIIEKALLYDELQSDKILKLKQARQIIDEVITKTK